MKRIVLLNLCFMMLLTSMRSLAAGIESGKEHAGEESVFSNQSKDAKEAVKEANAPLIRNSKVTDFARAQEQLNEELPAPKINAQANAQASGQEVPFTDLALEKLRVLTSKVKSLYAQSIGTQPRVFDSIVLKDATESVKRIQVLITENDRLFKQYINESTQREKLGQFDQASLKKVIEETIAEVESHGSPDQDIDEMQSIVEVGNSILDSQQEIARIATESKTPVALDNIVESTYRSLLKPLHDKLNKLEERKKSPGDSLFVLLGGRVRDFRIGRLTKKMQMISLAYEDLLRRNESRILQLYKNLKTQQLTCGQQLERLQQLFDVIEAQTSLTPAFQNQQATVNVRNKILFAYQSLILNQQRLLIIELTRVQGRLSLINSMSSH